MVPPPLSTHKGGLKNSNFYQCAKLFRLFINCVLTPSTYKDAFNNGITATLAKHFQKIRTLSCFRLTPPLLYIHNFKNRKPFIFIKYHKFIQSIVLHDSYPKI